MNADNFMNTEQGRTITQTEAFALILSANDYLKQNHLKPCSCGACYVCAFNFVKDRIGQLEREAAEVNRYIAEEHVAGWSRIMAELGSQPDLPPRSLVDRVIDRLKQYQQLVFGVERKFPGETRHETALRYILEAERKSMSECSDLRSSESIRG